MSNNNEWEWIKPERNGKGPEWVLVQGQEPGESGVRGWVRWNDEYKGHGMWHVGIQNAGDQFYIGAVEGEHFTSALGMAEAAAGAPRGKVRRPVIEAWRPVVVMPEVAK